MQADIMTGQSKRSCALAPNIGRDSGLVYDVGLHLSEDTDYYLRLGYRVVAFEANPDLVASCRRRFERELASERLTIVAGAIADGNLPGQIKFYKNPKSVWGMTSREWAFRNAHLGRKSEEILVDKVSFPDCFARFGVPHLIKIDVEGVDDLVLDTLGKSPAPPKSCSVESEKVAFDHLTGQFKKLQKAGYRRFKIAQQATVPGSSAVVETVDYKQLNYRFERHASGPFGEQLPGRWMTEAEALDEYRRIFRLYRAIGDASVVGRWGRVLTKPLQRILGVGLPGWHDLHAAI